MVQLCVLTFAGHGIDSEIVTFNGVSAPRSIRRAALSTMVGATCLVECLLDNGRW